MGICPSQSLSVLRSGKPEKSAISGRSRRRVHPTRIESITNSVIGRLPARRAGSLLGAYSEARADRRSASELKTALIWSGARRLQSSSACAAARRRTAPAMVGRVVRNILGCAQIRRGLGFPCGTSHVAGRSIPHLTEDYALGQSFFTFPPIDANSAIASLRALVE